MAAARAGADSRASASPPPAPKHPFGLCRCKCRCRCSAGRYRSSGLRCSCSAWLPAGGPLIPSSSRLFSCSWSTSLFFSLLSDHRHNTGIRSSLYVVTYSFFTLLVSQLSCELLAESRDTRKGPGCASAGNALDPGLRLTKQQRTHASHLTACAIITLLSSNGVSSLALRSSWSTGLGCIDREWTSTDLVTALAEGFSPIPSR